MMSLAHSWSAPRTWASRPVFQFHVALLIADYECVVRVKAKIASGARDHSWFRLSAVAVVFRRMRAEIDGIERGVGVSQERTQPLMNLAKLPLVKNPARDAGLIANQHDTQAEAAQLPECSCGSWNELNFGRLAEINGIIVLAGSFLEWSLILRQLYQSLSE